MSRDALLSEAIRLIEAATSQEPVKRRLTRAQQDELIPELHDLNYSQSEIARRLGLNRSTVANRLRRLS